MIHVLAQRTKTREEIAYLTRCFAIERTHRLRAWNYWDYILESLTRDIHGFVYEADLERGQWGIALYVRDMMLPRIREPLIIRGGREGIKYDKI